MKLTIDVDLLIVGQGLAGSILAWQLMRQGKSLIVIGDSTAHSSSRVAAGLFNPITGQRLVLQKNAETIIPAARRLYHQLETYFGRCFFYEKQMYRVLRSSNEQAAYEKRVRDPAYRAYIGKRITYNNSPVMAFIQQQTGYVDTNGLLDCLKQHFMDHDSYLEQQFDYPALTFNAEGILWQGISARKVIFCEGSLAKNNPWLKWLPFQASKGEILTLNSHKFVPKQIINAGKWLLPLQDGRFKTGATYSQNLDDISPTDKGRDELLQGLAQLVKPLADAEVCEHKAGVRPNTLDKQPFIGTHPDHTQLLVFNGFGSKGTMLIPWYAQSFSDHLTQGLPLPAEANIERINKRSRYPA